MAGISHLLTMHLKLRSVNLYERPVRGIKFIVEAAVPCTVIATFAFAIAPCPGLFGPRLWCEQKIQEKD